MTIFNSYVSLPEGTLEVSIESRSVSLGGNKGDTLSYFSACCEWAGAQ